METLKIELQLSRKQDVEPIASTYLSEARSAGPIISLDYECSLEHRHVLRLRTFESNSCR